MLRAASGTPVSSKNCFVSAMPRPRDIRAEASCITCVPVGFTKRLARPISAIAESTNSITSRRGSSALDFILANPEDRYFETPEEKHRYLIERFKLSESLFSPSSEHGKAITFSEGFPLCVAYPAPDYMPVVTFTYVDPEHRNLDRYVRHLRTYRPLFRQLPGFQFIYISTAAGLQQEAGVLFSFLVEGRGLSDLARYFDIQTKWDNKKYGLATEDDLIFRNQVAKRFSGEILDALFRLWRRNQLPNDLRAESETTRTATQKVLFRAVTVPGQEAVFGDSSKRWGDGWQVRGASGAASVPKSRPAQSQVLERRADA